MNSTSSQAFQQPLSLRSLRIIFLLLCSAIMLPTVSKAQTTPDKSMRTLSLDEIASEREVSSLIKLLKSRQLEVVQQTNEVMKAQGFLEYEQSRSFGAIGRYWIIFELIKGTASVHVSFYYDKHGYILGRGIVVENVNIP